MSQLRVVPCLQLKAPRGRKDHASFRCGSDRGTGTAPRSWAGRGGSRGHRHHEDARQGRAVARGGRGAGGRRRAGSRGGDRGGAAAAPEVIVHQMTALGHAEPPQGRPGVRRHQRAANDLLPTVFAPDVTAGRGCLVFGLRVDSGHRKVMVVRVFVAGGTGVVGRRLVPQLVARGHQVTATTTSAAKLGLLERLGADGVVMDGLDALSVGEAVAAARPDAIVHQMTAIAGMPDMKHIDRWFATTNRLRTEGTDHLLAAAEATGVSNFVAQSYACWNGIRTGGW